MKHESYQTMSPPNIYSLQPLYSLKILTITTNVFHALFSTSVIELEKCLHLINLLICVPSKTLGFNLSQLNPGNVVHMTWKQSPSTLRVLTNCFISPSLIWRGEKMIFSRSTHGWCMIFFSPTAKRFLTDQSFCSQCLSFARISHRHKKHWYFVYPPCCPSKRFIIFRSTYMTHLWSSYLSKCNTTVIGSCLSFK